MEKRYVLPKNLVNVIDYTTFDGLVKEASPMFIIGEEYIIDRQLSTGNTVFQLVKVVDELYGMKLDSVIVKKMTECNNSSLIELSSSDCKLYGIQYEKGLYLYPKSLPWKRIIKKVKFDPNDLSTNPLSMVDNTIRYILLSINGFKDYQDDYIITPNGSLIKEKKFINSLHVTAKEPIVFGNGQIIKENAIINTKIVCPKKVIFNHGNFLSSKDEIFLLVILASKDKTNSSIDGMCGVEPIYLNGVNPNDLLEISWDEFGAYTKEEYEEIKQRQLEERRMMIEREEKAYKNRSLNNTPFYQKIVKNSTRPSYNNDYGYLFQRQNILLGDSLRLLSDSISELTNQFLL